MQWDDADAEVDLHQGLDQSDIFRLHYDPRGNPGFMEKCFEHVPGTRSLGEKNKRILLQILRADLALLRQNRVLRARHYDHLLRSKRNNLQIRMLDGKCEDAKLDQVVT